jgi:60 kDa SS-A/Ro ribonucleoprotein
MRFNESSKGLNTTTNFEGAVAYKMSPEMELYSLVCTTNLQNKFYESSDDTLARLRKLIKKCQPMFVAQLAIYARTKMYLRSVPLVLVVEMCKAGFGSDLIECTTRQVIQRADELTEILAYYSQANNRTGTKKLNKLHNGLKRGIASAFGKFDEYQFAKYNRDGEIKLRDVMFLTHPKPEEKREFLYKKIADNKLETPDTWEVKLSKNDGRSKKSKWEELIKTDALGYMALMRNLRNMLEAGVSMGPALEKLTNREAILRSRQFPFRFLSAYEAIKDVSDFNVRDVMGALETAILTSVENIKGFNKETKVFVVSDVSGSMQGKVSQYSSVQTLDIGLILGMLLQYKCDKVMTGIFADRFKLCNLPKTNVLANIENLHNYISEVGGSTNGWTVLDYLIKNKIMADKVMIFTDCQMWDSDNAWGYTDSKEFRKYWTTYQRMNPTAKLYLFNLAGYETTPIDLSVPNVYQISGWNEKVFEMLDALENGSTNIREIEKIEIGG